MRCRCRNCAKPILSTRIWAAKVFSALCRLPCTPRLSFLDSNAASAAEKSRWWGFCWYISYLPCHLSATCFRIGLSFWHWEALYSFQPPRWTSALTQHLTYFSRAWRVWRQIEIIRVRELQKELESGQTDWERESSVGALGCRRSCMDVFAHHGYCAQGMKLFDYDVLSSSFRQRGPCDLIGSKSWWVGRCKVFLWRVRTLTRLFDGCLFLSPLLFNLELC